jgi:hypothetical protein
MYVQNGIVALALRLRQAQPERGGEQHLSRALMSLPKGDSHRR